MFSQHFKSFKTSKQPLTTPQMHNLAPNIRQTRQYSNQNSHLHTVECTTIRSVNTQRAASELCCQLFLRLSAVRQSCLCSICAANSSATDRCHTVIHRLVDMSTFDAHVADSYKVLSGVPSRPVLEYTNLFSAMTDGSCCCI